LPEDAEALCNLGTALAKIPRLDEAERWLLRALKIDPVFAAAHVKLGTVYQLQGRYGEAEISLRRAMALYPDEYVAANDTPHSSLLFMLNHDPGVQADALFAEHCRVGAYLEGGLRHSQPQRRPRAEAARCLQVGFVSADFRYHSVASFIEPILRCWRRSERLRITLYHNNPIEDEVSRRLRGYVSRWHTVFDLSNAELVARIREDRIDILIDLAGHTAMHRLRVFAHKPAPVQVSWLGYPATTGLQAMDYYLTDRHFFPKGEFDRYFTEKLVYVPAVWTFDPSALAPPVNRLPALTLGYLTFGSFNRLGKINETTIQLWARLLRALPTARKLIVGIPLEQKHRVLIDWFAAAGITRERLGFHPWTDTETHLKFHNQVDIALESTPYTGCTTSNHALWMGVPSLTLAGSTPASRLCAANLGHLGLDEFIAASPDEFVAKGLYWAGRLDALADLRAGLRSRWQRSPARDSAFVAAGIEVALRRMWQRWCSGSPPQSFEVTAAEALASIPRTSGTLV
jgi:predicted O-linked N-acetylglucosamine transferase (SPINDLY family)